MLQNYYQKQNKFDLIWLSEFDPMWNDDGMNFIINPESALFGNPFVLSSQPIYDAIVPVDTKPTIEFDRDMLRTSIVSSFLLMSDDFQDVRTAEDGDFVWSDREVTFQPLEPLVHDKYYTMSLNGNGVVCRDLSGNELFLFETKFYTESE